MLPENLEEATQKKTYEKDDPSIKGAYSLFFYIPNRTNFMSFGCRALLYIILVILGIKFIFAPMGSFHDASTSFLHYINLPFHEGGHIVFRIFGSRLLTSLGGTLMQLLVPLVCFLTLLFKNRDTFGAAACLWWFGENFLDIAPYIDDARSLTLPLIGGNFGYSSPYGFHDWEFILSETNLLKYDHTFANLSLWLGAVIIIASLAWGGFLIFHFAKNMKH